MQGLSPAILILEKIKALIRAAAWRSCNECRKEDMSGADYDI